MERKMFDFAVNQMNCVPGGIKEACIIVREYLNNCKFSRTDTPCISSSTSSVTIDEFIQAISVLLAYSWKNRENDCVPEFWKCDNDCSNINLCIFCPGEFQLTKNDEQKKHLSKKLCPYFRE